MIQECSFSFVEDKGSLSIEIFCVVIQGLSVRDRKGTPKNFCDKDFAELSGEFSGAICLKTLVLLGSALELFRTLFGAVRAILWLWGSFLALDFYNQVARSKQKIALLQMLLGDKP